MRSRRDIQSIAKYNLSTAKMVVQEKSGKKDQQVLVVDICRVILQNVSDSGIKNPRPWKGNSGCGTNQVDGEICNPQFYVRASNPMTEG